ncbi:MAG: bifunctional glutamine synthetase adenylyltransferase/deadenyltransferase, partial [Thermoleophilia bacterium]|nr:bifunctional glutamine synthetase adenylyltransferase/deadenyltransferase [Thermoleophilia bacterium]
EWERYALIKARVIAGDQAAGARLLALLKPFVYRKYLDFGAFAQLRDMKKAIEREMSRRGMHDNIKLGPGGIREIEFIGQLYQLLRGGREPKLQSRSILATLEVLRGLKELPSTIIDELLAGYDFLRRAENRLQMMHDRQTQTLPLDDLDQARLALAMGYSSWGEFM